jgi:PTS system mannose-specific IIB component
MNIVLVRVDDRLIHGQILESWIPFLKAQCVIVANDSLAHDQFQRAILSMAIPDRIKVRIVPIEDTLGLECDQELMGKSTLIIVSSIKDALRLHEHGVKFLKLNVGNMKGTESSTQVSYSVWLVQDDVQMLKILISEGLQVNLQSVPREREIDMQTIIDAVAA